MDIEFNNKDKNYSFSPACKFRLSQLAEQHWSKLFDRESLSVFFVTEDEMRFYDIPEDLDYLNSTDYMGLYIAYHDKYGSDIIFICPARIKQVSKKKKIDFEYLLYKVFTHELAHSLMTQNVFSVSEVNLYSIPSFKFFEESLCNAFALLHFSGFEKDSLTKFCKSQSLGYCHFYIWDEIALLLSMKHFKSFKGNNHFLFNYLWIEKSKDVLFDDKNKVLNNESGDKSLRFEFIDVIYEEDILSNEVEQTRKIINGILKLDGFSSFGISVIRKKRDSIVELIKKTGFLIKKGKGDFLLYKYGSLFVRFFCLNRNDFSIFVVKKEWLENLISYPFHTLIASSQSMTESSATRMDRRLKYINPSWIKVGMTMIEVQNIVGENNLLEAAKYFKPRFVGSDKIMTFNSGGDPTGCILGFKDDIVNRIIKFSTSD